MHEVARQKKLHFVQAKNPKLSLADFFTSVLVSSSQFNEVAVLNPGCYVSSPQFCWFSQLRLLEFFVSGCWSVSPPRAAESRLSPHQLSSTQIFSGCWNFLTLFFGFSHLWLLDFLISGCWSVSPPRATESCLSPHQHQIQLNSFLQIMQWNVPGIKDTCNETHRQR